MLATDAYAYLDIDNPICAWATYRGALVCAPDDRGFVSVWVAGLLRRNDPGFTSVQAALEDVRVHQFPHRISRLRGMFCFPDVESAERARSWDKKGETHFQPKYLAKLSLSDAGDRRDRLDANWITYAPVDAAGYLTDHDWIPKYWAGEVYPDQEPIWETLVDGRLIVLGTDIRQRAYEVTKSEFPDSLMLLELSRQAAWVGSELGTISSLIRREGDEIVLSYAMNMVDAENPVFLEKLAALRKSGHPINLADMKPHIDQGSFGRVPDLRPYGFRSPLSNAR